MVQFLVAIAAITTALALTILARCAAASLAIARVRAAGYKFADTLIHTASYSATSIANTLYSATKDITNRICSLMSKFTDSLEAAA